MNGRFAFLALLIAAVGGCNETDAAYDDLAGPPEDDVHDHGTLDDDGNGQGETLAEDAMDEEDPGQGVAAAAARVASPVPGKKVTYAYGVKNPRYAAGYHTGQDYAAATGTNVVAVRSGKIRWSNGSGGAYGNWIGLDADNGRTYVYCHLSTRSVAAGKTVTAGQVLGKVGATGNVTGPHLHFEDHPKGKFVYAQVRKPAW